MADEKFSVVNVKSKMGTIENYFSDFSDTLSEINAFVQANVNASLGSSAFGDLGGKLLSIWDHNASTFNDFHENFDNWAQVVAIIAANNNSFAVDALATYRDNAGTLAGVKEARELVSKNNGIDNISSAEGFGTLSASARSVLDFVYRMKTRKETDKNEYDGKTITYTDAAGNKVEIYYDDEHRFIGRKVTDKDGKVTYYDSDDKQVDKLITGTEYKEKKKKEEEEAKAKEAEEEKAKEGTRVALAQEKYAADLDRALKSESSENLFYTVTEETINGHKVYVTHIVINDGSQINGEPANGSYGNGLETSSSAAKRVGAKLLINGSHFLENGKQDLSGANDVVIVNGKVVSGSSAGGMEICLDKNGKLFTAPPGTSANDLVNMGVKYTFSSHDSHLIGNGKKYNEVVEKTYNRTVIGMTEPGEYYIVTGSTGEYDVENYLYDKGCSFAKSMDQGGSVSLVSGGDLVNTPTDSTGERPVGDYLYFT